MAWQVEWLILCKMIVKMLTHIHMMVYAWWCWHICKGEEVGVDVDQFSEGTEARVQTPLVECLPIESGQSDGATGTLYRKDRVSQSGPDVGHVVTGRWGPGSGQWRQIACRRRSSTGRWQGASGQAGVR